MSFSDNPGGFLQNLAGTTGTNLMRKYFENRN